MHFYAVHPDADLGAELVSCLFWALHGQSTWVFQCLTHLFTSVPFIITPILQTPVKQEIEESQNGWGWKGPQEVVRPNPGVWSKEVSLEDFGWADAYIPMSSVKSTWGPLQGCTTLRFFILQYPYLACPITQLPICPLLSYSIWVVGGVAHRGGKKWAGTWEKKVVWERDTCRTTQKCFFVELGRWRRRVVEQSSLLVRTIFHLSHGSCWANRDEMANTPSCWCPQIHLPNNQCSQDA